MPGFSVGEFSEDLVQARTESPLAPSRAKYYYNYTWFVPRILGLSTTEFPTLIHLKDMTPPTFTASVEKYIGGSLEYKFAKNVSWDDVKVTWYDTVNLIITMTKWRQSVWRYDQGLRPASSYKTTTELAGYLPTGKSEYSWKLYGSWPSTIKSGELTYTNSDIKTVEVTITYDYAVEDWAVPNTK